MPPVSHVGYMRNSGRRGTLDLLWSCLVTIFLCTYTIQRLQVVPWTTSKTIMSRKKAFWMFTTLLCPEYVTWIAFEQWQRARRYKDVCGLGHKDWTMQHGFYVDMGGFKVKLEGASQGTQVNKYHDDVLRLNDDVWVTIRLDDLILLLEVDFIPIPNFSVHDLAERSKSDQFARVITSFQVLYFVVRFIARLGCNLPVSPLEISTLAFVCCAAFIEYFWWNKPLDLRTATVACLSPEQHAKFISILPQLRFNTPEQDLAEKMDLSLWFNRLLEGDLKRNAIYVVWIGCIFNGIHITAWNFSFASHFEHILWKIASTGACGAVVLMWAGTFIRPKVIGFAVAGLSAAFYVACRIYLMVEVFVCLRSVPEGLYRSAAWQKFLPGV